MRNVTTTFKPWYEYKTYKGFDTEWLMTLISEGYDESISQWEIECAEDFRDILRYGNGHSTRIPKNFETYEGFDTEWLDTLISEGYDESISQEEIKASESWSKMKHYSDILLENKNDKPDSHLISHAKHLYKKYNGDIDEIRKEYPKRVKKSGYFDNNGKRPVASSRGQKQRDSGTVSFHVGNKDGKTTDHKLHIYDSDGEKRVYLTTHDSEEEHTHKRKNRSEKL